MNKGTTYKEKVADLILFFIKNRNKKLNVLDIGCGLGQYCSYYSKIFKYSCTGIDIKREYINKARLNDKETRYLVKNCILPPKEIKNKKYDLILFIGSRVLDFALYDKKKVIHCIEAYQKLLKKDGKLFIFEKTDFSGKIEKKAGWHFKTQHELDFIMKNFSGSKIFFIKGFNRLNRLYQNLFFLCLMNIIIKKLKFFLSTNYLIILSKNKQKKIH